jgi:hypothetical protein
MNIKQQVSEKSTTSSISHYQGFASTATIGNDLQVGSCNGLQTSRERMPPHHQRAGTAGHNHQSSKSKGPQGNNTPNSAVDFI